MEKIRAVTVAKTRSGGRTYTHTHAKIPGALLKSAGIGPDDAVKMTLRGRGKKKEIVCTRVPDGAELAENRVDQSADRLKRARTVRRMRRTATMEEVSKELGVSRSRLYEDLQLLAEAEAS